MDQNAMVNEQFEGGERLIEELNANGIDIQVAFWTRPTEKEQWYLYLSSKFVDEKGSASVYRLALGILRRMPDILIDPSEIQVVGSNDSLAEGALAEIMSKASDSPFAARNPRTYPGITWFRGSTLGGVSIDGAYIYSPSHSLKTV